MGLLDGYRALNSRFVNAVLGATRALGLGVPEPVPLPLPNPIPNPAAGYTAKAQQIWPGATIAGRRATSILHQHPEEPNRFMLDVSLGRLHYGENNDQEIDISWQPSFGDWTHENLTNTFMGFANGNTGAYGCFVGGEDVRLDIASLAWVNDQEQTQIIPMLPLLPNLVGELLVWPGLWGVGTQLVLEIQPGRMAKKLEISTLLSLPLPVLLRQLSLSLKFKLTRSPNVRLFVEGLEWDENTVRATSDPIEFRHLDGRVLWSFKPPRAFDANVSEQAGTLRLSRNNDLFVEMRLPYTWLQSATFPVIFDPTIDVGVSTGANDASERDDGTSFSAVATSLVCDGNTSAASRGNGGALLDFTGIVNGDTVDVFYVTFHAASTAVDSPNVDWVGEDVDTPANYTDTADVTSRTRTTATVQDTRADVGTGAVNSPSLVTIGQELVDRPGFTGVMNIFADGRSDANSSFRPVSYDGSTTNCWQGHLEYTAAEPPAAGSRPSHRYPGFSLQGQRLGRF